ncbi:sunset domain-containing protein [Saccharopolyspora phatthalungensis]|uniref:Uncharacterized protein n=1 Tax=Saccharopolyspora phatthalungensis TaxID=664693 RepID=A0A840QCQ8_9PSEU|nr:hypothetical protein [Saccharopolyspora phatthalungensis]MBB5154693.1 hypothetical protein [Saccharopolyspora phatthalungensis]
MITWLFTQVWLWSLAAFAFGALITWLLFVRPLRRRLVEGTAPHPADEYEHDQSNGFEERDAPLDLLRPVTRDRDPEEEPEVGDWGRAPRAWVAPNQARAARPDADSTWFREWDERVNGVGVHGDDVAVAAVQPRVPPALESQAPTGPKAAEPKAGVESPAAQAKAAVPFEDEQSTEFAAMWPNAEPETTTSSVPAWASEDAAPATETARVEQAEPEPSEPHDEESRIPGWPRGADDATESRLSGHLRSLFESVEPRGADDAAQSLSPIGADATEVIPKFEDGGAAEPPPLPRRTPGAGPRPGREVGSGPMIKGHSASRQYHSPESPAYDKIVPDVWFRTAGDAEIAGFEPWNGKRAT